jgi:hypothetical protein
MLLILAPSLSSSQSVVKKIGGEDKIIISKVEGEKINAAFDSLETLVSIKDKRIDSLMANSKKHSDSLRSVILTSKDTFSIKNKILYDTLTDYKSRYYKNIEIYKKYEEAVEFEIKLHRLNSVLFAFLAFFLYSRINN